TQVRWVRTNSRRSDGSMSRSVGATNGSDARGNRFTGPSFEERRPSTARGAESRLGLREVTPRVLHVPGPLDQRFGVPFAQWLRRGEEVAGVDVDRASEFADGVQNRMDDVASQRRGIPHAERPGSDRVDTALGALPEEVVLATEEDADDGPHVMVMRLQ